MVTDVSTHGLRRTAGVLWLASGVDIFTVSRLLGHESVTTTVKSYAGIADCQFATALDVVDKMADHLRREPAATIAATTPLSGKGHES